MTLWQRRLRGATRMGLTWGLAWLGAGLVILLFVGPDAADVPFPLGFGMLGFLAGMTFSLVLAAGERHRRLEQLSLARFAGWGAVAGLVFAALFAPVAGLGGALLGLGVVFGLAGAASAAGTLVLARQADRRTGGRSLVSGKR